MNQHLGPLRFGFVAVLAASLTTCRFDKLINPAIADRIAVSPDSLRDSANFGSIVTRAVTLRIASADGATLSWSASAPAPWLTLTPTTGGAPDSLVVTLDPDTLSQVLHQTTIVLTSAQARDTVRVPVRFNILPPAPELSVSPTSRADSAFTGSALPDTFSVRLRNTGALPLTWSAALDTGWVTLSDSSGVVAALDSTIVLVTLRPESLAAGIHGANITITAPGAIGSPAAVPVAYTIRPCVETGITPDVVVPGSIALSDCGAPHKAGSQAKVYSVQAAIGDTLSLRLTAAFDAYLVLTNSSGTVLDQNDECPGFVGTACIINFAVTATGRYVIEATTAAAGTGAFTMSLVRERTPGAPQAIGQFRSDSVIAISAGATTTESVVVLKGTLNDPNPGDSVRLEVELVGALSGPKTDSSAFVAVNAGGVPVGVRATGLIDNEAYRWRARTCDKTGRCSAWLGFGNPDPAVDFFVNAVPEPPAAPSGSNQFNGEAGPAIPVGGGTGGGLGSTQTLTFRAQVTDPDPGDVISLEVEVQLVGDGFNGAATRGVAVSSGSTALVSVNIQAPLLGSRDYHWRARACDQTNRCGAWVPFGNNSEAAADFHVP